MRALISHPENSNTHTHNCMRCCWFAGWNGRLFHMIDSICVCFCMCSLPTVLARHIDSLMHYITHACRKHSVCCVCGANTMPIISHAQYYIAAAPRVQQPPTTHICAAQHVQSLRTAWHAYNCCMFGCMRRELACCVPARHTNKKQYYIQHRHRTRSISTRFYIIVYYCNVCECVNNRMCTSGVIILVHTPYKHTHTQNIYIVL